MSIYTKQVLESGGKFAEKSEQSIANWKKQIRRTYPASHYRDNSIGRHHRRAVYIKDSAKYMTEKQYDSLMAWVNE